MVKKSVKRKIKETPQSKENEEPSVVLEAKRQSDEPVSKKAKWINRERVLTLSTRGISQRDRHLLEDLKSLLPHSRSESKMERQKSLQIVNEICSYRNCNKALLFEGRSKRDLYAWMSDCPEGPSVKFMVENVDTSGDFKLTGNCLKGSRPLLSFGEEFNSAPHYRLIKELLSQIFDVPNKLPMSKPFFDHVYSFNIIDNKIFFRNFEILTEDAALVEIGPRFVLNPVKIFAGSFGGETIWNNPRYTTPAKSRQALKQKAGGKYINRIEQKQARAAKKPSKTYQLNPLNDIFKPTYTVK